jgi:16S rRNA (cytosine1402-N4)-methyltransferase
MIDANLNKAVRIHEPVMPERCSEYLITKKDGVYFDATIGFGGHAEIFLKRLSSKAKYIGCDLDENAFYYCKDKFKNDNRITLYNLNYSKVGVIKKLEDVDSFDGIFADLGVSSFQLDNPDEGFTYRFETNLDLRFDKSLNLTAADIVNSFDEKSLSKIFFEFGEELNSKKIASAIVEFRKEKRLEKTTELVEIIKRKIGDKNLNKTLSRIFQALRIYVNNELENIDKFVKKAVESLATGGRIVILTYHSLEDRAVKRALKYCESDCVCPNDAPICRCDKQKQIVVLTKKPIEPDEEEIKKNPRARSAKLRAAERI